MARLQIEGTAKAIAIFAAILIVSTGLCGVTWQAAWTSRSNGGYLILLGIVELLGMLIGAVGFLGSLATAIIQAVQRRFGADDSTIRRDLEDNDAEGDRR